MSDSQEQPWSNNPNAPNVSRRLYIIEKGNFAGILIESILYGIIIVVFFQCIAGLFNPAYRKGEGVKWGLVSYTVAMFSFVTVQTSMDLYAQSISYIDNREFSDVDGTGPSGPYGYQWFIDSSTLKIIPDIMFTFCNWLADGLLLYRCYMIYSRKLWVIAFPCLMYLGSLVTGILFTYQARHSNFGGSLWFGLPYFSISLSLNILLTLLIAIRLIAHAMNTRNAVGITGAGGMCKAIVTMLVESCALYAVSSLLVLGPQSSAVRDIFIPTLSETQVIAPLLIIQRVTNKSALKSNTLISGRISPLKVRSRGKARDDSGALPCVSSVDEDGTNSSELRSTTDL